MSSEKNTKSETKPEEGSTSNVGRRFNNNAKRNNTQYQKVKFEGEYAALKGHTYDCGYNQVDLYTKTTKLIAGHVASTFTYGDDAGTALESLEDVDIPMPEDVAEGASKTMMRVWEKQVDEYVRRTTTYRENMKSAYNIIWGQCSEILRAKLEAKANHNNIRKSKNSIELLKNIKDVTHSFSGQKFKAHALHEAKRRFYTYYQDRTTNTQTYLEKFKNLVEVVEHCGGSFLESGMAEVVLGDRRAADMNTDDMKKARELYLATAFILASDRSRYSKLIEDLENNYIQGVNRYPTTLEDAYNVLMYWKHDTKANGRSVGIETEGVAFVQDGERRAKDMADVECYACHKKGHIATNCPNKKKKENESANNQTNKEKEKEEEYVNLQIEENLLMSFDFCMLTLEEDKEIEDESKKDIEIVMYQGNNIKKDWIILDNGSTVDIFCNKQLLKNVRETSDSVRVRCNAGVTVTNMKGELPGYGTVWYNPNGMANILSLARVSEKYKITYDSTSDPGFKIHKDDGDTLTFRKNKKGLFYMDMSEEENMLININEDLTCDMDLMEQSDGIILLNTVLDNAEVFNKKEVERAKLARKIQGTIGHPSTKDFEKIVELGLLGECPINIVDIKNAEQIFGPSLHGLKGKTVRKSNLVVEIRNNHIPVEIMNKCENMVICGDIMFVNKIPFFITITRGLNFGTVETLQNRKVDSIINAMKNVKQVYDKRGFKLGTALLDGEFEVIRGKLAEMGMELNCTSRGEHVPEVERYIRTVKERVRCMVNSTPFKTLPKVMLIEAVKGSVFWINSVPSNNGVSNTMSPRQIMTGTQLDYKHHCRIEYGAYAQMHEPHSNNMESRTAGGIALRPSGNAQGGMYFMNLSTGKVVSRLHWTELPIPDDVIKRVNEIGKSTGESNDIRWEFVNGDEIVDEQHENQPVEEVPEDDVHADIINNGEDEIEGVLPILPPEVMDGDAPDEIIEVDADLDEVPAEDVSVVDMVAEDEEQIGDDPPQPIINIDEEDGHDEEVNEELIESEMEPNDEIQNNEIDREMSEKYGPRTSNYGLRPRKPRDYGHFHVQLEETCMTQYGIKKGLKEFGMDGAKAVIAEMRQLEERKVLEPKRSNMLTKEEKYRALQYLMFLKKKRCGKIKARGCADGRKQRIYKTKEETSAPTVSIESVMLTCAIEAYEHRVVATADVPGAFMHADMDEDLYMKLEGPLVKSLVEINKKKYGPYVEMEGNKEILYVKLKKALYGTLQAALLFWKELSGKLIQWGFVLNPYDSCVANKMIDGKQCTIIWHVDDLKISHVDEKVVEMVLDMLDQQYGKEAPLVVTRGKVHEYLGMTLDFSVLGKCRVSMDGYVDEIVEEFLPKSSLTANTPAASHLFDVNDKCKKLDVQEASVFHQVTAKLLFLCKRARPDIQTAIAFLATRVKGPDEDDQKKLWRVLAYLNGTKELALTLEVEDLSVQKWWIDGSYAIHRDMRSHTGGVMSLGKGAVYSVSTRQKLTTKSSTEAELVAVADVLPQVLWTRYFLESQGYAVQASTVYQDNKSAILLEKNGRASSSKRTRHLNIRYFFVTDRVKAGEAELIYCPTQEMTGDYLTKPLQGSLFKKFRKQILNI
jgi:Reverse transcriptase (RNA-dependent DNA polymerase)